MAKQAIFVQPGKAIDVTLTADVSVGDVMVLGDILAIAKNSGLTGEVIGADIDGVFEITAKTADAITLGAVVYFDNTNKYITTTATDNTVAGVSVSTKAAAAAGTINVKINV